MDPGLMTVPIIAADVVQGADFPVSVQFDNSVQKSLTTKVTKFPRRAIFKRLSFVSLQPFVERLLVAGKKFWLEGEECRFLALSRRALRGSERLDCITTLARSRRVQ